MTWEIQNRVFEITFLVVLVLGVIFSFLADNLVIQIAIIFLFGLLSANLQKLKKFELNFPYVLLIVGFVLGYLIATKSGQRFLILASFILGLAAGNVLKKLIKIHVGDPEGLLAKGRFERTDK